MSDLQAALVADARSFVSRNFGDVDLSALPFEAISTTIEKIYEGGWVAYSANFHAMMQKLNGAAKTEVMSPVKVKLRVEHFLGRKLREYDQIKSATFTDTDTKIVVSIAKVDRRTRSDLVTDRSLQLHHFTRPTASGPWEHATVAVAQSADEGFVRYGTVMTPERHESIADQFETCYRPGGVGVAARDGWMARAEGHHKDFYPELHKASDDMDDRKPLS